MLIPLTRSADFLGLCPTSRANVLVKLGSPTGPGPVSTRSALKSPPSAVQRRGRGPQI